MQKDGHVIVIPTQVGIQGTQLSARGASASLMLDIGLRRYGENGAVGFVHQLKAEYTLLRKYLR